MLHPNYPNLSKIFLASRYFRPGTLNAYLLATLLVGLSIALRVAVAGPFLGAPFITVLPAIVVTAVSGVMVGLFAIALGSAFAWFFILALQPVASDSPRQIYVLLAFMAIGGLTVMLIGAMRMAIEQGAFNRMFGAVFEGNPDAILLADRSGFVKSANKRASLLFDIPREALTGMPVDRLLPERLRERHAAHRAGYMAAPRPGEMGIGVDLFALRGDGTELPVDIQIGPIEIDAETLMVVTVRDLTERKRLRDDLEASRRVQAVLRERERGAEEVRLWASAFQHAAVGIGIGDAKTGIILHVNAAYAAMHGMTIEDSVGRCIAEQYPPEERQRLRGLIAEQDRAGHLTFDARHVRKDGSAFAVRMDVATVYDAGGAPLFRVASCHDLTESNRIEAALRQATKMEAVGTLTGGLAHDFNNLLGVIVLNLDVAQRFLADTDRAKKLVADALASARSGAALIRSLLAFARHQPLRPARVELNELVSATHRLLSRTLGEDIEIVFEAAPDLWPVIADSAQIEACLLNFAANARDAMPRGGRLTIATGNQRLDADYAKLNPSATPGDYAMIVVSDTGTGMTQDVAARIFEPFFTTKEPGEGTGLGLSMVFGFAAQSGGHVSVYSEPGLGTTFRLFLPRAQDAAGGDAGPVAGPVVPEQGHGEAILVVEDNAAMREAVLRQVASLNYRVLEADSASAALILLERETVALVFSDVVMPGGMDGFELAEQVGARWPSVGMLLTSGFSGDRIGRPSSGSGPPLGFLRKPYDLNQLARAVRETLSAKKSDLHQS